MHRAGRATAVIAAALAATMALTPAAARPADERPPAPGAPVGSDPSSDAQATHDRLATAETTSSKEPPATAVPGQLIVRYEPGTATERRAVVATRAHAEIVADGDGETVLVETDPASIDDTRAALEADPAVESVDFNHIRHAHGVPTDPLYSAQSDELSLIRAPQAWDLGTGAPVKVAVLDSGIDLDHPDLQGRILRAESFIGDTGQDTSGHGTAVAGIIAATANNGQGISGVAPNVQIISLRVLDAQGTTTDYVVEQALWRAMALKVDVVNMSFGAPGNSVPLDNVLDALTGNGVVVVASAGNDASPAVDYPASHPGVVAVGATDATGAVGWFSNHGSALSVVAPGIGITSTKFTAGFGGTYGTFTGTSFAAPFVSGVAALRARSAAGVKGHAEGFALMRTAQDRGVPGYDTSYGYGIIDAFAALGAGQLPSPAPTPTGGDADSTIDRATTIAAHATAGIAPATDEDWFAVDVPSPSRLQVAVTPPSFDGSRTREMDPVVEVYDAQRQLVASADWEASGEAELVGANAVAGRYYIRVWNYNGSESPGSYAVDVSMGGAYVPETYDAVTYEVSQSPSRHVDTTFADITGDGRSDRVSLVYDETTYPGVGRLRTSSRNPNGTYAPVQELVVPGFGTATLLTGDFDGDGRTDVTVADLSGWATTVYWGTPTGLVAGDPMSDATDIWPATIGDVDGDGADEVLAHTSANELVILRWNGTAAEEEPLASTPYFTDPRVADFDGDADPDILIALEDHYDLYSEVGGVWTARSVPFEFGLTDGLEAADVTGDGLTDLVVSSYDGTSLSHATVLVQEDGDLVPAPSAVVPHGYGYGYGYGMKPADLDGDGRVELIRQRPGSVQPWVYTVEDGTPRFHGELPVPATGEQTLRVHDVDGDSFADLTVGDDRGVHVHTRGVAAPSLSQGKAWVRDTSPLTGAGAVSPTANLTVSSYRDLASSSVRSSNVWLMEGRSGQLVPSAVALDQAADRITINPSASLLPSTSYTLVVAGVQATDGDAMPLEVLGFRTAPGPMPGVSINGTYTPIVGEFDGDGANDIFWYSGGLRDAQWLGGSNGFRSLGTFAGWPAGLRPLLLDMDGDSFDDFLVYTPGTANGPDYIIPGGEDRGDVLKGYFQQTATFVPLAGDFDGDGYDDLFWYAPGSTADQVWYGGPQSASPWRKRTVTVNGTYRPAVGDFNGDQYDDVFWHGPGSAGDSMWKGGPSGFTSVSYAVNGSYTLRAGDFDGNGFDDLFFYAAGTAPDSFWQFSKAGRTGRPASVTGTYRPAVGDFDADGYDDLLFYAPGAAADSVWWGTPTGARRL